MAENIISKLVKLSKGKKELQEEVAVLEKAVAHLNEERPLRTLELTENEKLLLAKHSFLTAKGMFYVANVKESDLPSMENAYVAALRDYAQKEGIVVIPICAALEGELAQLDDSEAKELLETMGLKESGLDRLIKASFKALGLITFLTTGEIETRAWTITKGTLAPEAAGKIHTDLQKGFIRAEVVTFEDMVAFQGRARAKEAGKVRLEGKEYEVKDGDVIIFLHN
jgi:GTP-binding protein YchF